MPTGTHGQGFGPVEFDPFHGGIAGPFASIYPNNPGFQRLYDTIFGSDPRIFLRTTENEARGSGLSGYPSDTPYPRDTFGQQQVGQSASSSAAANAISPQLSSLLSVLETGQQGDSLGELFKTLLFLQTQGKDKKDSNLPSLFSGIQL